MWREPVQSRAKAKVCAILDATDALLEAGVRVDDLSMRDVARRASVKPATLYDYFPTKELLLRALEDRGWARAVERTRAVMEARRTEGAPLTEAIASMVETFMMEMRRAARKYGLTPESPFGPGPRERMGAQFAAMAARAFRDRADEVRKVESLALRVRIAIETVALLTWVGARDHAEDLEDGSYGREVGWLIAHYFVRDPP